jgi:Ca2+-binding RTX toxin-like protein
MEHCLSSRCESRTRPFAGRSLKLFAATLTAAAIVSVAQPAEAAVAAVLNGTTLEVTGDGANDIITLRLEAGNAANLQVFDGAVLVNTFAVAGITVIDVDGGAGNDTILVDEANGPIAVAGGAADFLLDGGDGDDIITGGADAETLNGGNNNDTLLGRGGTDILNGGDGNDNLTGGPGGAPTPGNFEPHNGGPGDDTIIWFNGDGSDIVEGGDGNDTQRFDGNVAAADDMDAVPGAVVGRVLFTRAAGNINMDIGTTENLLVNSLGGNDDVTLGVGLNGLILITINGGDGDDIIRGGDGPDVLNGDAGNDTITGGAGLDVLNGGDGNDTLTGNQGGAPTPGNFEQHNGGPGDDTMVWNNGDGSDIQEGGPGNDISVFNGNVAAADVMNALAGTVAGRVLFTRAAGNINMDIGTTETLQVNALGGDDDITVQASFATLLNLVVDAGAGADTIKAFLPAPFTLNGNTENDTLIFDAQGQPVELLPNAVRSGGVTRVAHSSIETINLLNAVGTAPTITITSPTADPTFTSSAPVITLAGTAADAEGIQSIAFTSDRGGSGTVTGTTNWTANVPLTSGANIITVTVTDTNGNSASDILTVTVDELIYTLAEGATGTFFDTDILIANPTATAAPVTITYLKGDGTTVTQNLNIAATSRTTILVDGVAGLETQAEVSATVVSTDAVPLVVERTMRWDATGYGAHTEKATGAPTLNWFFAEGSQGFFQTFLLLANPGAAANRATVTFLREGATPVTEIFDLLPTSRRTIFAGDIVALRDQSFGIQVVFDAPGVAERAMYFGQRVFEAGHESAGVNAPSTEWFLAEGATGTFFTTFLLVANPGDTDANVTYTYLPATGLPIVKTRTVAARSRWTGNIATEDASLANAAVATRITSTQPVIAERAQYWPSTPDQWFEAHNSFGATSLGLKWGLAEGRVGTPANYLTYILLANPSTTAANVRVTYLKTNGTTVVKTYTVEPTSRFNVEVHAMVPELANESFGALIEVTNSVGIAVERAMYSDSNGVVWAAGTNALGTQLP